MARHGAEWAFRFRLGAPGRPRSARTRLRDMKPQRAAAAELVVHEVVLKPNESLHMLLSCSCFSGSGLQRQVIIICVFAPSIFPIARTRRPSESSVEFRLPTPRRSPHVARPRAQIQKTVPWKRRAFKNSLQKKRFVHAAQQTRSKYTCRDTRMRLHAGNTVVQGRFAPGLLGPRSCHESVAFLFTLAPASRAP